MEKEPRGPGGDHRGHRPGGRGGQAGGPGRLRAPHRPGGRGPDQTLKGGQELRLGQGDGASHPLSPAPGAGLPPVRPVRGLLLPAHHLPGGAGAEDPAGPGRPCPDRGLPPAAPEAHPGGGEPQRLPEQGPAPPGPGEGRRAHHGLLRGEFPPGGGLPPVPAPAQGVRPGHGGLPPVGRPVRGSHLRRDLPHRGAAPAVPAQGLSHRGGAGLRGGKRPQAPPRERAGGGLPGTGARPCQRGAQRPPGQD